MSIAPETLEGWYCLSDFRKIDWKSWKSLNNNQRQEVLEEIMELWNQWTDNQEKEKDSHALFQILVQLNRYHANVSSSNNRRINSDRISF